MTTRTAKQMAGGHKRTLKSIQNKLLFLSVEWDEVDQFLMGELNNLSTQIDGIIEQLNEVSKDAGT